MLGGGGWRVILARRSEPPAELAASLEITRSKAIFRTPFPAPAKNKHIKAVLGYAGKQPDFKRSFPRLLDGRKLLTRLDGHRMNGIWWSWLPEGHEMDGSARLFISCPKNRGFPTKSGLEMNPEAHPFISWPENESGREFLFGRGWNCGTGGTEQTEPKKIFPVCQCELWRGLALPYENIFLDVSLSGRGGDEFISGQNSELCLTARYFRPE